LLDDAFSKCDAGLEDIVWLHNFVKDGESS
jgi:hypothetical protein